MPVKADSASPGYPETAQHPTGGSDAQPGADADDVVIIGAGPAGLTAAYELARQAKTCTVLEADDTVGGISRTVERDGWRFDVGGHRFFTKVKAVEDSGTKSSPATSSCSGPE